MSRIESVTSAANPLLKDVRRAVVRGGLTSDGLCVAEGFNLLEEALRSELEVPVVLVSDALDLDKVESKRTIVLPEKLFQSIAATETSQGVMALVRPREWLVNELFEYPSLVIVLEGIQDPGNAGAIVRAAEAFGATGVIFMKGTVSPYHPRTLRASAGSLFRVPYVAGLDFHGVRAALEEHHVDIWAAGPWTGVERVAEHVDFTRDCALIIGSEGRGVSREMRKIADDVAIATAGVESLNAAMAATVLLYEIRRQRE